MAIDRNKLHQTRFDDLVLAKEERDSPISPGEILREEFLEPPNYPPPLWRVHCTFRETASRR